MHQTVWFWWCFGGWLVDLIINEFKLFHYFSFLPPTTSWSACSKWQNCTISRWAKNLKVSLRAIFLSTSLHSLPFLLLSINHISVVAFCISFVVLNACVFHVICYCLFDSYPHQVLDLSSNNLVTIEGLKDINLLTWLSLANNNIKAMENLHQVREPSNCKTIQQTNDYGN